MIFFTLSVRIRPTHVAEVFMKASCLILALYMWGVTTIAVMMMSSVWSLGGQYLQDLQNSVRAWVEFAPEYKRLALKHVNALRPVRVNICGLYHMERDAKLTFMNFIIVGTVNVLLLLQNK